MVSNILFIVVLVLFIIAIVKVFNRNSKLNNVEISRKKFENNNDSDWKTDLLYESGEIRRQFKFRDERTQLNRSFFKNGNIELTWNYIDGIQSGEETEFDENGNIIAKRNYSQGKQDGESISYFENGNIEFIVNYSNGKPHGKATEFFNSNSNKIKVIKKFKNGELNGPLTEYFENENIKRKRIYKDGELEGLQIDYYATSQIREKSFLVNGLQHGQTIIYTEFGMTAKDQFYQNGELIKEKDNISELKAIISLGSDILNKTKEENPTEIGNSFLFWFYYVLSEVHDTSEENVLEDSKEEKSEYEELCKEIDDTLLDEIKKFSKEDYQTKYPIEDNPIVENYFFVICARAWNYIVELDINPNNKFNWQDFNFEEYLKTYAEDYELGEEHYIKTLEPPLICFIHIYNKLQDVINKIKKLDSDFNITRNIHYKKYELLLAHTHAAVYAYFSLLNLQTKLYSFNFKAEHQSLERFVEFKKTFKYFNFDETKLGRIANQEIEKIAKGENTELLEKITKNLNDERQKDHQILYEVERISELNNEKEQDLAINDLHNKFGLIAINQLSCSFIENKDYQKSIDILLPKLNDKDPNLAFYYDTLSVAYYNLEDYSVALDFSNLSINLDSNNKKISEHYYNRARIYLKIGETEKAKIDLKKAVEIDDYEDAKNLLEEISS